MQTAQDSSQARLSQAIESVQFEPALLHAAVDELMSVRPDALGGASVAAYDRHDLGAAIGHALAVAGALNVASEEINPLAELQASGLFDLGLGTAPVRFRAMALDYALTQAPDVALFDPAAAHKLQDIRGQVRSLLCTLEGCDDAALWNYTRATK